PNSSSHPLRGGCLTVKVSAVQPVSKWLRFQSILNGDFTPLHQALVEFDSLTIANGSKLNVRTEAAITLISFYTEPSKKPQKVKKTTAAPLRPASQNGGILGTAKQTAKDRINGVIGARTRGVSDMVRGPNKKERLIDFLWAKLPYRPQYLR